jgi:hypothetical protein
MRTARLLPFLMLGFAPMAACAKQDAVGITLALGTDLVVPDDINAVALVVSNAQTGALLAAPIINPTVPSAAGRAVRFPSTIALETAFKNEGSTFSFRRGERLVSSVQIALIGLKGRTADEATVDGSAVTLRRIVTTMPEDGVHLLRLNLGTLDVGGASGSAGALAQLHAVPAIGPANALGTTASPLGNIQSTCDDPTQDLANGICAPVPVVNGDALPLFDAAQVFGGAPNGADSQAQCFDIPKCLADATPVVLDADGAVPSIGVKGFALVRADVLTTSASNAACVGDGAARRCFAPLDEPELSTTGAYTLDGTGRAKFGPGIVAALKSGKIRGLVAMQCAKTAGLPVCAPWSSVVNGNNRFATDAGLPPDASIDAAVDATVDANDAGLDSSIDAGPGPIDAGPDASDGGADAGPSFLQIQSLVALGGNDVRRISDFVVETQNGGFKDAVIIRDAAGMSEVVAVTPNAANGLNLVWPLGVPTFPAGRVAGRLSSGPIVFFSGEAATAYRVIAAVQRDAGGIVSGFNGSEATPNGICKFAAMLGPSIFDSGTTLMYSREADGHTPETPVFQNGSFPALSGAIFPDFPNNRYRVLLGASTGERYPLDLDLFGTPPQLPSPNHASPGLLAGAVRAVATVPPNFWFSQASANGELAIREVTADDIPTGRTWTVPVVPWDFNLTAPAPGMAAVSKAASTYLFSVVPDGIVAYDTAAGRPAGYVVRGSGFDARKLVAENGCVYFALWSSGTLAFSGGLTNSTPGLYQVCLP